MTGDDVTISLVKGIGGTAAAALATKGWSECYDNGWSNGSLNMDDSHDAFLASFRAKADFAVDGFVDLNVGVLTWVYFENTRTVWVWQSYVKPEYRGRGIYRKMWHAMVEYARDELKARKIESGTHVNNTVMRKVAEKMGRREIAVVLSFDL